jgi:coenzyme PQQ precursor peptide PqqA
VSLRYIVCGGDTKKHHACGHSYRTGRTTIMSWTTPTLVEICIGLEINGYLPAEF